MEQSPSYSKSVVLINGTMHQKKALKFSIISQAFKSYKAEILHNFTVSRMGDEDSSFID